jgi:hypothetical protein
MEMGVMSLFSMVGGAWPSPGFLLVDEGADGAAEVLKRG